MQRMKIDEVIITEWSSMDPGIRKALVKKGYKFLGSGADQSAYLEPSTGQVLKIFGTIAGTRPGSLSADQKMALHWIEYCNDGKNNPLLPRFSGWETFEFNDHNYLMIRMEHLGKFPRGWALALEEISEGAYYTVNSPINRRASRQEQHSAAVGTAKSAGANELIISLGQEMYDLLWETCEDLARVAKARGYQYDLHYRNFMIRNDGTPVIVDPWVL